MRGKLRLPGRELLGLAPDLLPVDAVHADLRDQRHGALLAAVGAIAHVNHLDPRFAQIELDPGAILLVGVKQQRGAARICGASRQLRARPHRSAGGDVGAHHEPPEHDHDGDERCDDGDRERPALRDDFYDAPARRRQIGVEGVRERADTAHVVIRRVERAERSHVQQQVVNDPEIPLVPGGAQQLFVRRLPQSVARPGSRSAMFRRPAISVQ